MGLYQSIFDQADLGAPHLSRDQVAFYAFGKQIGDLDSPAPLRLTMRFDLDAHLFDLAIKAGAHDFSGRTVLDINTDAPSVTFANQTITAPVLIGADGVNSMVAKALFDRAIDPDQIGFALEVEQGGNSADTPLRIDFGAAHWGYGWQFPKPQGTTIGIGGIHARNPHMKRDLARYLDLLGVSDDLKVKGQFLPFGFPRKTPGKGPVLLAGDAAGLVDPITGEGIAFAMQSGQIAATSARDAINAGRPQDALRQYKADLRPIYCGMWQARQLRHLLFNPRLRDPFIDNFRKSSTMKDAYMRLLAGETEYGAITRRAIKRLPSWVLRAVR